MISLTVIIRTVTYDDVGESHLLPHALIPRQSGMFNGLAREFFEVFFAHVQRSSLRRTRSRVRGCM